MKILKVLLTTPISLFVIAIALNAVLASWLNHLGVSRNVFSLVSIVIGASAGIMFFRIGKKLNKNSTWLVILVLGVAYLIFQFWHQLHYGYITHPGSSSSVSKAYIDWRQYPLDAVATAIWSILFVPGLFYATRLRASTKEH